MSKSKALIDGYENFGVKRVDCSSCAALCCRQGVRMDMSPAEVEFMGGQGHLQEVEPPHRRFLPILPRKNGVYRMPADCIHLVEGSAGTAPQCDSHESPNRPVACGAFSPGAYMCRVLRMQAGIDTPEDFKTFLDATAQITEGLQPTMQPAAPQNPPMAA